MQACGGPGQAAPRERGGWVEILLGRQFAQRANTRLLGDNPAAVAVHLERQYRIGEALPVVIHEQQGVQKRVAELVMQRPVGVGHVEPGLDHLAGKVFARLPVAPVLENLVLGLAPGVGRAVELPRLWRHLLVGEEAERRDHVLAEVLVLVVAPDHHRDRGQTRRAPGARCGSRRSAPRGAAAPPTTPGRLRTLRASARASLRDADIARAAPGRRGPASRMLPMRLVGARKRRKVGDAETQYLSHFLSSRRAQSPASALSLPAAFCQGRREAANTDSPSLRPIFTDLKGAVAAFACLSPRRCAARRGCGNNGSGKLGN